MSGIQRQTLVDNQFESIDVEVEMEAQDRADARRLADDAAGVLDIQGDVHQLVSDRTCVCAHGTVVVMKHTYECTCLLSASSLSRTHSYWYRYCVFV